MKRRVENRKEAAESEKNSNTRNHSMKKRWTVYILLLLILVIGDACIPSYEISFILIFVILCPIFSILYTAAVRKKITLDFETGDCTTIKGEVQKFRIVVQNASIMLIPNIVVNFCCRYSNFDEPYVEQLDVVGKSLDQSKITRKTRMEYAGNVKADLSESCVYDLCGLVCFHIECEKTMQVQVMPALIQPDYYALYTDDSNAVETREYSEHRSGDDPSEIHDVREYAEGDAYNRVHWKLSARQDELLVKEFSMPVSRSNCIVVELNKCIDESGRKCLNGIYELVYAIGNLACLKEKAVTICYYSVVDAQLKLVEADSMEALERAMLLITRERTYEGIEAIQNFVISEYAQQHRIMYISEHVTSGAAELLLQCTESEISCYCVKNFAKKSADRSRNQKDTAVSQENIENLYEMPMEIDGIHVIEIDCNDIKNGLAKVKI